MNIKEIPALERPREKLQSYGKELLSSAELLAIIIGTGTSDKSALSLAEEVLSQNEDGLFYLQNCSVEELSSVKGMGLAKATKVIAALELGKRLATTPRRERPVIRGTQDVVDYFMEKMRYYDREYFKVALLNTKGAVIGIETISVGDMSSSVVHPRETFKNAVKRGAYAIVLVHNHPSGDPTPSPQDIETTKRLKEAGEILGIRVLDHVIIGDGIFISLKTMGVL